MNDIDIKKLIRDPQLYYVLVPVVCALWPIWLAIFAMPAAQKAWKQETESYELAQKVTLHIIELDPERLTLAQNRGKIAAFSYPAAVEQVAHSCGIPSAEYKLQLSATMKTKEGQQTQDADISLKQVDLKAFAKFLSTMQLRWADLQCTSLKLTKQKGAPDIWKADMKLKYYF
jgi:hypothetical protein